MGTPAGIVLAKKIAGLAFDKKAENIRILDLRALSAPADFFVIATASSEPHLRAVCDGIRDHLESRPTHVDGYGKSDWVAMDYFDVIVHLFHPVKRKFFNLEGLWSDAKKAAWNPPDLKPPATRKPARARK